ncbi:hypothetical protein [Spirosoma agri]|uniref:Uncharacterized protein n=1 Tax=Spirosoma agri TaxID=1987381 RepID=A0A6M0IJC2_9BACT|nr:hypothetical protein [Spirosoma agri]NEU67927.1 hypothetical protein [Spirosoma agri]
MSNSEVIKTDGIHWDPNSVLNSPPSAISQFTTELSALMKRHGIDQHVVVYTLLPNGSVLSFTSDYALVEAHSLITARVHQIKSSQTNS